MMFLSDNPFGVTGSGISERWRVKLHQRTEREVDMKRFVSILAIAGVLLAGASSAFAGGRYYRSFHRHHPRVHYVHSGDHLAALGFGILAGVIISDLIYQPQPVVVYRTPPPPPAPVVVNRYYTTPPPPPPPQEVIEWVTVTVKELNVRSGPGAEHPVTGRVRQGDVLELVGRTPGWFAVKTPDGLYGWVMDKYTALKTGPLG